MVIVLFCHNFFKLLLSLKFEEIKDSQSYHADVRLFRVHDVKTDRTIGHFYIDLHPREGKYGHACVTAIKVIDFI